MGSAGRLCQPVINGHGCAGSAHEAETYEWQEPLAAAAPSGMSLRTAREWDRWPAPSTTKPPRDWRTRPGSFAAVWVTDVEPLLRRDFKGVLEAKLVLEVLRG